MPGPDRRFTSDTLNSTCNSDFDFSEIASDEDFDFGPELGAHAALPRSTAIVRQTVAVRFLTGKVYDDTSGRGSL